MARAPSASRWSTKRYILAALAGILASTIVIIVVSTILKPAEIRFSVVRDSCSSSTQGVLLNLTIYANNTSQRAGVRYHSTLVYLKYTKEMTESLISPQNITAPPPQSPASKISIDVSTLISTDLWSKDFADRNGTASATRLSVLVIAVVRFKVGPAYTRRYDVKVLCDPVDYFSGSRLSSPANCSPA